MWDGIIVGGGLAGLITGIRASERGRRILIISQGVGSLINSSGVIDFGDVDFLAKQAGHPYALLGKFVAKAGVEYFQKLLADYEGKWGESQLVLTPLGTLRRAGIVPKSLNAKGLKRAQRIVLMAPEGMKDFFPEVIKGNLERIFSQGKVEVYPFLPTRFKLWLGVGKPVTAIDFAKYWQSTAGGTEIENLLRQTAKQLSLSTGEQAVLVFPGLAAEFSPALKNILAKAPFPVLGMTAFPPSPSGQNLYEHLKQLFRQLGGELLLGAGVKNVELKGKRCQKVFVDSKGKTAEFSAHSFVLATGGVLGGGIEVMPRKQQEIVFQLPLYLPAEWSREEFLGEQPYARLGIEVDSQLRPIAPNQEVILENVRVVGRTLAHWDPWVEHCGGGVSLASGWFAGEKI